MKKSQMLYRSFNWVFVLLSMTLLFRLVGAWHNTLKDNGNWRSNKAELSAPLPGAVDFITSPLSLRGEALHLGVWGGHQQVQSLRAVKVESGDLSFDTKLGNDSFVIIYFADDNGNKTALRLSRSDAHPSATMKISRDGAFHEFKILDIGKVNEHTHFVRLVWKKEKAELLVDHKTYPLTLNLPKEFHVGFASGTTASDSVDNIHLRVEGQRKSVFHDSFLPNYSKPMSAALFCVFLALVGCTGIFHPKFRFFCKSSDLVSDFWSRGC